MFINDTIPEDKAEILRNIECPFKESEKMKLIDKLETNNFEKLFELRAPGRMNLVGEHTDYNGGKVLPFSIDPAIKMKIYKVSSNNCQLSLQEVQPLIRRS